MQISTHNVFSNSSLLCAWAAGLLRLIVFQTAALPYATWYERLFYHISRNYFLANQYCNCRNSINAERVLSTVELLKSLGGNVKKVRPVDQQAEVEMITLSAKELRFKIEALGSIWHQEGNTLVIQGPQEKSKAWDLFAKNTLARIFAKRLDKDGNTIFVTAKSFPDKVNMGKARCILLSSFATPYVMKKYEIGFFLGMGMDVCVYDSRGNLRSPEGYASEAGFYNDIDAVADELIHMKYRPRELCLFGYCAESFPAIHLFRRFHEQGINMILQAAPLSLDHIILRLNILARILFYCLRFILLAPFSCYHNFEEDGFSSFTKIQNLPRSNQAGFVMLAGVEEDQIVPVKDLQIMAKILERCGNQVTYIESKASNCKVRVHHKDPHFSSPIRASKIQAFIMKQLYSS